MASRPKSMMRICGNMTYFDKLALFVRLKKYAMKQINSVVTLMPCDKLHYLTNF